MEQEGECGDGGYGSRLYFRHKDSKQEEWNHDVSLSRLPGYGRAGWTPSYFDGRYSDGDE
jgi:hypothetical protein